MSMRHWLLPCFNPRTPAGYDRIKFQRQQNNLVSTRVPQRDTTSIKNVNVTIKTFQPNPRTHKGCDRINPTNEVLSKVSTHAPIKDATYHHIIIVILFYCFNPRTHKGCDLHSFFFLYRYILFQPTHP